MKKGIELLFSRNLNDKIDIETLEKQYNIFLPPLYKLFIKSFLIGENKIFHEYLHKETPHKTELTYFIYEPNPDIMFTGFNPIEQTFVFKDIDDIWVEKKYLPIGHCGFNGGILLGTTDKDKDRIILETVDLQPRFSILSENIFEFIRGLVLIDNQHCDIDKTQLYKNWGEDFWRIREDKE